MKKLLLLTLLSSISFSEINGKLNFGYEESKEGFFYKNINGNSIFHNETTHKKFKISDLELMYNDNIKLEFNISKNSKYNYKPRINTDEKATNIKMILKTPDIYKSNISYDLEYQKNNDFYLDKKDKELKQGISFNTNDFLTTKYSWTTLKKQKLDSELKVEIGTPTLNLETKYHKINDKESHLKNVFNFQNKIIASNDGHNHGETREIGKFDKLQYNINDIEDFLGSEINFSNKGYDLILSSKKNIKNIKINSNLSYSNQKYSTAVKNKIDTHIKYDKYSGDLNMEKDINENLGITLGNSLSYTKITQEYHHQLEGRETKVLIDLVSTDVYTGIAYLNYDIYANLNYTYNFSPKFSLFTGLNTKLGINRKNQYIDTTVYNNRKNAAETEIKRAKNEIVDEKKLDELKKKRTNLEEKVNELNSNKNLDTIYEKLEKNKTLSKEIIDRSKLEFNDKSYDEIEKIILEKEKEIKNFETEYGIDRKITLDSKLLFARTKEQKLDAINKIAEIKNITNKDEFVNKYLNLYEYKKGVYSNIKTEIVLAKARLERELKSATRDYLNEINRITPDPFVLKNYEDLKKKKEYSYNLTGTLNPYLTLKYNILENLSLMGNINIIFEFNKNLTRHEKLKHHIHIIPKIEFRYEF